MTYDEWEQSVPQDLQDDPVWRMHLYRLALFLGHIAWHDVTRLNRDGRTQPLAGQLLRAIGSIAANIAEGYSRRSGKDQARFYEYALGSCREACTWSYQVQPVLGDVVLNHRLATLSECKRLLLTMTTQARGHKLKDETPEYSASWQRDIPLPPST